MKKFLACLLIVCLGFLLLACQKTGIDAEKVDKIDLSEYKTLVGKCNDDIMELSILLSNMGQYEHNYWKILNGGNGAMDYDSMVSRAFEWLEREAEIDQAAMETKYQDVCDQYKKIFAVDVTDSIALDVRTSFLELFDSFNSLYLLVTAPSGSMSDFVSHYNTYSGKIKNINSTLSLMVSD